MIRSSKMILSPPKKYRTKPTVEELNVFHRIVREFYRSNDRYDIVRLVNNYLEESS